jgi:hypothetical protein
MLKIGQKVSKNYTVSEVINTPERIKEIFSNDNPNEKVGIVTKKGNLRLIGEAFLFNKICGKDPVQAEIVRAKWIQTFIDRGCFMAVKEGVVERGSVKLTVTREVVVRLSRNEFYLDLSKLGVGEKKYVIDMLCQETSSKSSYSWVALNDSKIMFNNNHPFVDGKELLEHLISNDYTYFNAPVESEEEIIIEEPITANPTEYTFANSGSCGIDYDTKKENIYDKKISIEAWALALNLILVVIGVISFYFAASLPLWFWVVLVSTSISMNIGLIILHRKIK